MVIHPAYSTPFSELHTKLLMAEAERLVTSKQHPDYPHLWLYTYTQQCVFQRAWDETTTLARGLILDVEAQKIVAAPFPKFFNLGERNEPLPSLPFEVFEKMDGSLIILYHYDGKWRTATKGSFVSEQAQWAQAWIDKQDINFLPRPCTYLCEVTYPENKIVVDYNYSGLTLLGAYNDVGREVNWEGVETVAKCLDWPCACKYTFSTIEHIVSEAKSLSKDEEGFVLRYSNGHRIKIKGEEYLRLHRAMSKLTPLHVWEMMRDKVDLTTFKRDLPEEFWKDFDTILVLITNQMSRIVSKVKAENEKWTMADNKQVGLALHTMEPIVRKLIFAYREAKLHDGRARIALMNAVRPTNNKLEGYVPNRKLEEINES